MNSLISIFILLSVVSAFADQPTVGRKAAQKYFSDSSHKDAPHDTVGDNVLMLYIGQYTDSTSYNWGPNSPISGVGQSNYGLDYIFDQWHGMDSHIRMDFSEYTLAGNRAAKASFLPMITFPRAETKFPLYFGLGAGMGVFLQQFSNKSTLSFDYEVIIGARFMELARSIGIFFEYGMKNHLLLLSDGQFNGTALTAGLIFDF